MAEPLLVITGATASGKSELALALAQQLGGEIISMDSRQVYRGMDIGTAKPTPAERALVPHHGLDLIEPGERYSAGRFARDARTWIENIRARGCIPLVVGGTGFFLRALLQPLFHEPPLDADRRERLRSWARSLSGPQLERWLRALDPDARVQDPQRMLRVLEVVLLTGRPLSWWQTQAQAEAPAFDPLIVVTERSREALYARIDQRVHAMVDGGFVNEVRALVRAGYGPADPGLNATGYIELLQYLAGECALDEAVTRTQNATRAFARRQLTWFRHQLPEDALRLPLDDVSTEGAASAVLKAWRRKRA